MEPYYYPSRRGSHSALCSAPAVVCRLLLVPTNVSFGTGPRSRQGKESQRLIGPGRAGHGESSRLRQGSAGGEERRPHAAGSPMRAPRPPKHPSKPSPAHASSSKSGGLDHKPRGRRGRDPTAGGADAQPWASAGDEEPYSSGHASGSDRPSRDAEPAGYQALKAGDCPVQQPPVPRGGGDEGHCAGEGVRLGSSWPAAAPPAHQPHEPGQDEVHELRFFRPVSDSAIKFSLSANLRHPAARNQSCQPHVANAAEEQTPPTQGPAPFSFAVLDSQTPALPQLPLPAMDVVWQSKRLFPDHSDVPLHRHPSWKVKKKTATEAERLSAMVDEQVVLAPNDLSAQGPNEQLLRKFQETRPRLRRQDPSRNTL